MAMVTTVLRRVAVACALAMAVWVVHGPILSTTTAHDHSVQPHGWAAAPASTDPGAAADCLGDPGRQGDHGHTKVSVPLDLADSGAAAAPVGTVPVSGGEPGLVDGPDDARGEPAEPPGRPPINVLICVSRT
ncbi:hypothetical protein GCM10009682_30250 [Luedemannella flava]|uniref:Secreted protein n=1 Tax=Luedemannella flava TaxID=349316 RepID=A0ABN2M4I8_9ACTN